MKGSALKEKTAKGLAWSSAGNVLQLVLGAVFGIFLARLLNRSDYGMVGMLNIFTLIASTLQDSGFRTALANRKEIRHEDYNAVFWFNISVSLCIYLVLFFLAPFITDFYRQSQYAGSYDLSELTPLARFTFLGFVAASLGTAHNAYLFRTLQVKQKMIITLSSTLLSCILGITMAYSGFAYWALSAQGVAFTTCNTVLFWYFSKWHPTLPVSFHPLKTMFGFSSKLLINDICANISNNLLAVITGRFYSVTDVGDYSQANKWTYMGTNMLTGITKEVAQPVLRDVADERDRHRRVFRKMLRFTAFIAFPATFGLAFVAQEFLFITITDKWAASVPIMQILCIGAFAYPIQNLCQNLVVTKGHSDLIMWNTILIGMVQIVTALLCHPYGILPMVCCNTGINVCWLLVWFYFVKRETGLPLHEALLDMLPYAGLSALSVLGASFLVAFFSNIYLIFTLKIIFTALLYLFFMWLCGSSIFKECMQFVQTLINKHK